MARIVMKFGGTSMAGIERIRNVAARVKREVDAGHQVAVVVSAMAGETDRLVNFCREASSLYDPREYDVVVSAGEQVTSGLLAIALQAAGVRARSWLGWQLPIQTTAAHGSARIEGIDMAALNAALDAGEVAVIPGFQGVAEGQRVTTLGRGGSDTSAVAVAAAMKAVRCDIYTDVDGVYTTDPRIVPRARKLKRVTYEEMLELASVGAKVLVRSPSEPGRDLHGTVVELAARMGRKRTRGDDPSEPLDIRVRDVIVALDPGHRLVAGHRVVAFVERVP